MRFTLTVSAGILLLLGLVGAGHWLTANPVLRQREVSSGPSVHSLVGLESPIILSPARGIALAAEAVDIFGTARKGRIVKVYDNGSFLGRARVDQAFLWSLRLRFPLKPGAHRLKAVVYDRQGTSSPESAAVAFEVLD